MSGRAPLLALDPDRCDRCGRCVRACRVPGALKVGVSYIYVDWKSCDGCHACADACDRGAIRSAGGARGLSAPSVADAGRVVVGSRAEAKAMKRAAQTAEKSGAKQQAAIATKQVKAVSVARRDATADAEGRAVFGMPDLAAALATLLLTMVAKDAVLGLAAVRLMPAQGQVLVRVAVLGVFYVVQLAVLAFLARRHGSTLVRAFGLGRLSRAAGSKAVTVGLVAGLFVLTRAFSFGFTALMRSLGLISPGRAASELSTLFGSGPAGLTLSFVLVVLLAPLAEELLFRGVVLDALETRVGRWPAVLLSATAFGLYHLTPLVFVPTFVLGMALGWLVSARRSLWPAIVLHALYNAVIVAAAFWVVR